MEMKRREHRGPTHNGKELYKTSRREEVDWDTERETNERYKLHGSGTSRVGVCNESFNQSARPVRQRKRPTATCNRQLRVRLSFVEGIGTGEAARQYLHFTL